MRETIYVGSALEELVTETMETVNKAEQNYAYAAGRLNAAKYAGDNEAIKRREAAFTIADVDRNKVRADLPGEVKKKLDTIRSEMKTAYSARRGLSPSEVDPNTLELLKIPDIKPSELRALAERAIAEGNSTMLRIITSEAKRRYDALPEGTDFATRQEFVGAVMMEDPSLAREKAAENTFNAIEKFLLSSIGSPEMYTKNRDLLNELIAKLK